MGRKAGAKRETPPEEKEGKEEKEEKEEEKEVASPSRQSAKKSSVKKESAKIAPSVRVSEESKMVNVFGNLAN